MKTFKKSYSVDTGGGIQNDVFILQNDQCLVITTESIDLFKTEQDYEDCCKPLGTIFRNILDEDEIPSEMFRSRM